MKIVVLLSSYNGERYICEQIDSVLNQKLDDEDKLDIYIRDDGSSDATVSILRRYQSRFPNIIHLYCENNIGWVRSFNRLIHLAPIADYYAFCDQDDIWFDDKLQKSMKRIGNIKKYALYCGTAQMFDEENENLGCYAIPESEEIVSSMIKCHFLGCTMLYNYSLQLLLKKFKSDQIVAHDWWTINVCLGNGGQIIIDQEPCMKYRQHNNNVFGGKQTTIKRIKKIWHNGNKRERMAKSLCFYKMCKNNSFLYNIGNYRVDSKCKKLLLINRSLYNNISLFNRIFFKIMVLFNRI